MRSVVEAARASARRGMRVDMAGGCEMIETDGLTPKSRSAQAGLIDAFTAVGVNSRSHLAAIITALARI